MPQIEKKYRSQTQANIGWLYQKYSASLLGFIAGIIPDQQESEKYLVTILGRFATDYGDDILREQVTWLQLLQYSRNLMAQLRGRAYRGSLQKVGELINDMRISVLDNREKEIFCAIYYHGKSVSELAESMKESENVIRSQFKLSFDKIRSAGGN